MNEENYDILNDPVLIAIGKMNSDNKSVREIGKIVDEEELAFKSAEKRQALTSKDNLVQYNI